MAPGTGLTIDLGSVGNVSLASRTLTFTVRDHALRPARQRNRLARIGGHAP